ncbi:MAG: LysR family transcriptional regulator [Phyllobacteriaceae bacterium]|nr:LysR family transcriptional regulator [Phyllobacteriaceae bacterium]
MELRHLRYFVAVAEELNFTRAAARLRTAQPSFSQQIRDLEAEIGTDLLTRTKRHVALTEAGRVFLDEARLTLAQAQRAVAMARRAAHLGDRRMTIGFLPAAEVKIFPSMLTYMRARFPDLHLVFNSLTTAEQIEALLRQDIDVGFLRLPVGDPALSWEVVLQERLVAVLPADHPVAEKEALTAADLVELPFLRVMARHAGNLSDAVEGFFRAHRVEPNAVQEVENILTLMSLIGMGVGFSLLPDYVQRLAFRNVVTRPLIGPPVFVDLAMVWRTADRSEETTAFRSIVHETVRDPQIET